MNKINSISAKHSTLLKAKTDFRTEQEETVDCKMTQLQFCSAIAFSI